MRRRHRGSDPGQRCAGSLLRHHRRMGRPRRRRGHRLRRLHRNPARRRAAGPGELRPARARIGFRPPFWRPQMAEPAAGRPRNMRQRRPLRLCATGPPRGRPTRHPLTATTVSHAKRAISTPTTSRKTMRMKPLPWRSASQVPVADPATLASAMPTASPSRR
ncbi:hypothetical protein SDC9_161015 [bioreactor metagenome]|uniref:Uncharacterized protein n=1 Tax=bioreactor metagenome TaxID=1076179 RepID=A0A645FH43_9ZZZZ